MMSSKEYHCAWRAKQPPEWWEERRVYGREYMRIRRRDKHAEVLASMRRAALKHRYGITPEQLVEMQIAQDYRCAICGQRDTDKHKRTLEVDHDHKQNRMRKLLCGRCNKRLAVLEDREWVALATVYLESA